MTTAIRVDNLFVVYRTAYGDAASLQGVSLDVALGEVVCIIGPSGSGKSTLLRGIAGLETPTAGDVAVRGTVLSRLGDADRARFRARHMGVVSQYAMDTLAPDLSARDAVALQSRLLGASKATALRTADGLLDEVGLSTLRAVRTRSLSGGERQRVAVCAALAHGPEIVLADEPTGELDAASAAVVHALIARLIRERSATAVIVSHDAAAATHADRALSIADGRLAEEQIDGRTSLVVGPGGWVRLPADLRAAAGLGDRVTADATATDVRLHSRTLVTSSPRRQPMPPRPHEVTPTHVAELREVTKSFGTGAARRTVLDGVSARVTAGTLTALVGRSGSGKSTLLHLIAGMTRPDRGEIHVLGSRMDVLDHAAAAALRRSGVALVTQDVGLVPFLSAVENVVLAMEIRGASTGIDLVRSTLAEVGLEGHADHLVEHLSAGERQRAALARSLATQPALLLIDEPTSRLDRPNARMIGDLLVAISRRHDTAVICATHDDEIISRADAMIDLDHSAAPAAV